MLNSQLLNNNIAYRLVIYILFFSSFAALFSTTVQLFFEYKRDIGHIDTTIEQIRKSHVDTIIPSLWVLDIDMLKTQLQGIRNLPDVSYVSIRKHDGTTLDAGKKNPDSSYLSYEFPLSHNHRGQELQLGSLVVDISLLGVYQRLWDRVIVILATQTLKTFIVSIFIFFLFYFIIGRHLKTMAAFARTISLKNLDNPLALNRKPYTGSECDELGLVESAINSMRSNLIKEMETVRVAQGALMQSEERFRTLVANIPGIVYRCELTPPWHVEYISDLIEGISGYTPEDFLIGALAFGQLVHPDDATIVAEKVRHHVTEETPFEIEYRIVHKSGEIRWVFEKGTAVYDESRRPLWLDGVIFDITEKKASEKKNEDLEKKFLQAQKMEAVGRLAGGVAHDFNNMLNVILGHAEMALEILPEKSPLQEDLAEIKKAALRSADLTRQLLAFARKQTVAPKILDLNQAVEGMLKMLRRLIGENIDLAWHPGITLGKIKIDPTQIEQMLANLCVNAKDAIVDTGKITIETGMKAFDEMYCAEHPGFLPGEYVMLAVSDNGSGMTAETLANLFEPFFTTKEIGKGTGLGLATVYGIVKQNNGFINVYSEPDQGTTFKIYLSRHQTDTPPTSMDEPLKPVAGGHETILLVEDEPMLIAMTTAMLERQGYHVLPATTSGEAISLAKEHAGRIDLLITDVVMPDMNGRELARNLLSLFPKLKCLFVSGYTANVIAHHGVLDEGVHFLQKPFSGKDLAAKVREILDFGKAGNML
jgi:PAS domain S-box-containing protein